MAAYRTGPRPAVRGGDRGRRHSRDEHHRLRSACTGEPWRAGALGATRGRRAVPHRADDRGGFQNCRRRERHRPNQKMPMLDYKDVRAMLQNVADKAKSYTTEYGNISAASIGAIQRALLALEQQGG